MTPSEQENPLEVKDKDLNNEDLPEELQRCLMDIIAKFEDEDSWVRKQQIKIWKKNDEFWHGIQYIFWSESRQDWISPTETRWFQQEEGREDAEGPFYDFVVNIFRAHGESIIAALSAQIPTVRFPPDDADDEEDRITSTVYDKIADLIARHNSAKIVILRALFTLWNQGLVAAYHAPKADRAFGVIQIPKYKKTLTCENCNSANPVDDDQKLAEGTPCPTCQMPMVFNPVLDGFAEAPKTRVLIDIYGPLFVKLSYTAKTQKELPYLILAVDQPISLLKSVYPHVSEKMDQDEGEMGLYERTARTPSSFSSFSRIDENRNLRTLKRVWLRPWAFDDYPDGKKKEYQKLKKLYPNGAYVGLIGKRIYVESRNEDMDKYWTIGQAGLSQYIHSDPLGQPLISLQEARNVLFNLTLDTIEHGIPSNYADSGTLDFATYSKHESRPGMLYPIKVKPGERAGDKFYESSRASVSKEVQAFGQQIDQDSQFTVGDFPSVYGGPSQGKSRTLGEYRMSGERALNRLAIPWAFLVHWWMKMMEKCVHLYVENLIEDEKYVKLENNNYINVWIRRSQLTGHVGEVDTEGAETFPVSLAQKQALLMQLLQLNNEFLNTAMFDIENRKLIADALGWADIKIPGEAQRLKQCLENQWIVKNTQPLPIEPEIDDDEVHIAESKNFLTSLIGLDLKQSNPEVYNLVKGHLTEHEQSLAQKTQQQFETSPPGRAPQLEVQ